MARPLIDKAYRKVDREVGEGSSTTLHMTVSLWQAILPSRQARLFPLFAARRAVPSIDLLCLRIAEPLMASRGCELGSFRIHELVDTHRRSWRTPLYRFFCHRHSVLESAWQAFFEFHVWHLHILANPRARHGCCGRSGKLLSTLK
jgi:hypothetical protein